MDPQTFIRLSIGSLGLRIPVKSATSIQGGLNASSSNCMCEIRLKGFPAQIVSVPLLTSPEATVDHNSSLTIFYLEESDVKALMIPGCLQPSQANLEIAVYMGREGSHCGVTTRKQQIGIFRMEVGREWKEGKPVLLHNGWTSMRRNKQEVGKVGPELHLRVKLEPDPRYVFQFEDETALSPQIVQLQGTIRQPIFSCKFSKERRASQLDPTGNYWSKKRGVDQDGERRERKGWKVIIHDLSGSAVAAAFMATPFVPFTGCDRVAPSNPGAWLILRSDPISSSDSWHPWGRLEAWRETTPHNSICLRFYILPEGHEAGVLISDVTVNAEKGGEFFIDMDRQMLVGMPVLSPQDGAANGKTCGAAANGGFVMNCKVQGEGKSSKPLVHLGVRHVTCVEDAAIFMALAAAVDLSIEACRPFRRKLKKGLLHFLS